MSKSIAYKHYIRALSRWPKDNLRPECQLQDALRRRVDRKFLGEKADGTKVAPPLVDEKAELEQVNALYSLLENRYRRKYFLTGTLMTPASKPTHYTDLVKELELAPHRTWLGSMINKIKGMVRFS